MTDSEKLAVLVKKINETLGYDDSDTYPSASDVIEAMLENLRGALDEIGETPNPVIPDADDE